MLRGRASARESAAWRWALRCPPRRRSGLLSPGDSRGPPSHGPVCLGRDDVLPAESPCAVAKRRPALLRFHCAFIALPHSIATSAYRPTPLFLLPPEREPEKPDDCWLSRLFASRALKRRAPPPTGHWHSSLRAPRGAQNPGICCTFWLSRVVGQWAQNRNSAPTESTGLSGLKE